MKLSIVIPTKNEETLLPKLLSSIREQSFTDYEIIVADAGSTDETRRLAASFGARVVEGGMPGPGRNRGAEQATGELILFFDADVILPSKHFLRDVVEEMQRKAFDVATCRVRAHEGKIIDHAMHEAYNVYTLATEKVLPHAPGFCLFARRQAHNGISGFDEEVVFAEDHDYVRRAKKAGFRFGVLRKTRIDVSIRRLEKEGRMGLTVKYVFGELYMLTRGPFKRMPFRYEFEHRDPESTEE
jgi:glycosyltransferase involved in cell wall biosynthesis